MKQENNNQTPKHVDSAIELAILNGIEAYNREQRAKKNEGESRSKEAMEEAGYKPRRRSRAKGKGTKLLSAAEIAQSAPVEKKESSVPNVRKPRQQAERTEKKEPKGKKKKPVRILFFGGVGEIGKNMTAIEYGNDIIVIDAGIIFPTEEMPGIDLVFPDITYLVNNRQKIRGVFLTHGHEDHIGGVPYLMKELLPTTPVYGSKLTLALVDNKLR